MTRAARAVQVEAQAKINLRLKILAREESGFHQIETLFLRLDLADTVRVRRTRSSRSLDVTGDVDLAHIGAPEQNLAWRAADAYLRATKAAGGFAIEIVKRIPIGGGLGGGSADAGAVLRALDATSPAPLGEIALMSLAAQLGSDIPFLTSASPYALAWGRGERMLALRAPERRLAILVLPPIAVNTAAAYGWLADARKASSAAPARDALAVQPDGLCDWSTIASLAENDFEPVVSARHPEIGVALDGFRRVGAFELSLMSGSGSSVFAIGKAGDANVAMGSNSGDSGTAAHHLRSFTATRVEPVSPIE